MITATIDTTGHNRKSDSLFQVPRAKYHRPSPGNTCRRGRPRSRSAVGARDAAGGRSRKVMTRATKHHFNSIDLECVNLTHDTRTRGLRPSLSQLHPPTGDVDRYNMTCDALRDTTTHCDAIRRILRRDQRVTTHGVTLMFTQPTHLIDVNTSSILSSISMDKCVTASRVSPKKPPRGSTKAVPRGVAVTRRDQVTRGAVGATSG